MAAPRRINDANKGTFGAAVTLGGLIGIEFDAARILLGDLENIDIGVVDVDANLTTYMGNLVVRAAGRARCSRMARPASASCASPATSTCRSSATS